MKQENKLVLFIRLTKTKPILSGLVFSLLWGNSSQKAILNINTPLTKEEPENERKKAV
jgi:hypothetical protein